MKTEKDENILRLFWCVQLIIAAFFVVRDFKPEKQKEK